MSYILTAAQARTAGKRRARQARVWKVGGEYLTDAQIAERLKVHHDTAVLRLKRAHRRNPAIEWDDLRPDPQSNTRAR